MVASAVAGALLAAGVVNLVPPRYVATARLVLETGSTQLDRGQLASRLQVMGSRDLARQVVREQRLATRLPDAAGSEEAALEAVLAGLNIRPVDGSQMIAINYAAAGPRLAADVANAFADIYLRRQQASLETPASRGDSAGRVRLMSRADPETAPRYPRRSHIILAGGLLGLLAGLAAVLAGWRRRRLEPEAAGWSAGEVPCCDGRRERHLPWIGSPRGQGAGMGDIVRAVEARGDRARLVVVTGIAADEAVGACAVRLARELAGDSRVALVSLDAGHMGLERLTADPRAPGLADLLFGVASFSEVVHREAGSRCHIIPIGRGLRDLDAIVSADRLVLILGTLAQTYDHVVIAAPPLGGVAGTERLAALGPTVVLVTPPDEDGGGATDAVEAFDALAARGFDAIAPVAFAAPLRLPLAA
ncbi:tyrosine-protein kinase family protein [Ancylobacter lacus]|uniref:tyrosine-protein kinase family protein n=1 Tax=Ancylobacter lacus TaxID=2579970 RepID=UPI001BCE17D3|nr:lipopolysaccharide biosynthesis protein [Ancylobacter lacus]MBS7537440.1 lipopolysaccharide biosynthesis protein [Ancylobacter lacus]